ncbi:hypothetical protein [Nocardia sp. NPDC052566]|uniref:hypothetical protein n=1 Tax=Nocardia sp. NPDC052566 TaxID=3364330 RepID=UPI0037CB7D13
MFEPAPPTDSGSDALVEAAFGPRPGHPAAGLPEAANPHDHWLRAVILGGQGRYAAARAELRRIRANNSSGPVLRSLADSTEGSLLRQLGWHAKAAEYDGRAAALILPLVAAAPDRGRLDGNRTEPGANQPASPPDSTAALCDALTGLAADALGTGRLALAARLLKRGQELAGDRIGWRANIRWHWVTAETALAGGMPALEAAETAVALAGRAPSLRHRVKSMLLLAAANAAAGQHDRAAELATTVAGLCRAHELLPLRWAGAMLRAGLAVDDTASDGGPAAEAAACAQIIARRGGRFRPADAW